MSFNDSCSICLDDFTNIEIATAKLNCGHTFHTQCIIKSLRKSNECPNCRDTDGNPVSKVNNNLLSNNWDSDTDLEEDENDYMDFYECIKNLLKNNSELRDSVREYKKMSRIMERTILEVDHNLNKELDLCIKKTKDEFRESECYKNYLSLRSNLLKSKKNLKNKLTKTLEKEMYIPKDANSEYVSLYLDEIFR